MRNAIALCVIACVVSAASLASAANPGQVSHNALAKMGLAGLQPMSDIEGSTIRGKFASVSGGSFAVAPKAGSWNEYKGSANGNYSSAAGGSVSYAISGSVSTGYHGLNVSIVGAVAGGGAFATTK